MRHPQNSGDRWYRKGSIKRRLRAKAERNMYLWGWIDKNGDVIDRNVANLDEAVYVARWRRRCVRNEGKVHRHHYRCGAYHACSYCIANIYHSANQRRDAMKADSLAWDLGEMN